MSLLGFIFNRFFKHQLMLANVMKQIFIFIYIWVKTVWGLGGMTSVGRDQRGKKGTASAVLQKRGGLSF